MHLLQQTPTRLQRLDFSDKSLKGRSGKFPTCISHACWVVWSLSWVWVCVCMHVCAGACVLAALTLPDAQLHVGCQANWAIAVNSNALWGHFLHRSDMCCHLCVVDTSICPLTAAVVRTHAHTPRTRLERQPVAISDTQPWCFTVKSTIRKDWIKIFQFVTTLCQTAEHEDWDNFLPH